MNQTFSSRKLANKTKSDLWFMYLIWNNKPDFITINRFRKEKWNILEDIFVQIVKKCYELWIIKFWTVSLDWTKIYANASKRNNYDLVWLDKRIKSFFDEAEEIDKLEDEEYWEENENHIPEELKTKKWRDKKRKEIEENYKYLENNNIKSYIPHPENNWNRLDNYIYNQKDDTYEDKEWNIFKFKQFMGIINWNATRWRPSKKEQRKSKVENYKAKLYFTKLENGKNKYLYIAKMVITIISSTSVKPLKCFSFSYVKN